MTVDANDSNEQNKLGTTKQISQFFKLPHKLMVTRDWFTGSNVFDFLESIGRMGNFIENLLK